MTDDTVRYFRDPDPHPEATAAIEALADRVLDDEAKWRAEGWLSDLLKAGVRMPKVFSEGREVSFAWAEEQGFSSLRLRPDGSAQFRLNTAPLDIAWNQTELMDSESLTDIIKQVHEDGWLR